MEKELDNALTELEADTFEKMLECLLKDETFHKFLAETYILDVEPGTLTQEKVIDLGTTALRNKTTGKVLGRWKKEIVITEVTD